MQNLPDSTEFSVQNLPDSTEFLVQNLPDSTDRFFCYVSINSLASSEGLLKVNKLYLIVNKKSTNLLNWKSSVRHSLTQPHPPLPKNSVTAKSNMSVLNRFNFQTYILNFMFTLLIAWHKIYDHKVSLLFLFTEALQLKWVRCFWTEHKLWRHKWPTTYYFNPNWP